jgi:hypothetical protein
VVFFYILRRKRLEERCGYVQGLFATLVRTGNYSKGLEFVRNMTVETKLTEIMFTLKSHGNIFF